MRNKLSVLLLGLAAGLAVGLALAWGLAREGKPAAGEAAEPPQAESASGVRRGPHGEVWVHLDPEARRLAGIEVAPAVALELPLERKAYGRVLDPTPLASLLFQVEAARTGQEAARREAQRVKGLYQADENASARDLEAAQVALAGADSTLRTARAQLATSWGSALAARSDLAALVRSLVEGQRALVRVDVPPGGAPPKADGAGARLVAFGAEAPLASQFLGEAPQTDPLLQGHGLLFLVEHDAPAPGTAVVAWLPVAGPPRRGVDVPRAAVLRHQGGIFVYVERKPGTFERRALELVRPSENGWLATGPLAAGDKVVVAGAEMLLSSELQPQLEED